MEPYTLDNYDLDRSKYILRSKWNDRSSPWCVWYDGRNNTYSRIGDDDALFVIDYMRKNDLEVMDEFRLQTCGNVFDAFILWIV